MTENKRWKIIEEQFISYYGGCGYKISNGECGFWLWHSKEESQKVCDKLNELNDENDVLKQQLKTKYIVNKQYEELQKVKEENEQLKHDATVLIQANQDYRKENVQLKQFQEKVAETIEGKMGDNVCNDYKMQVLKEIWNELNLDEVWFE